MELENIYKCLCDLQRLRIINLLKDCPLCVCHLQEILEETQVKISKQLQYLKKMGLVVAKREANWMIYSLCEPVHGLLQANLNYLQENSHRYAYFSLDLTKRTQILQNYAQNKSACPLSAPKTLNECCTD